PQPRRVLYVDGEMPASVLQERIAAMIDSYDFAPPDDGYFRLLSADLQREGLPDLAMRDGQQLVEELLADAELLVVDNLSTLFRRGVENEAESWAPVQEWLLSLRRADKTVMFVHHAGKGGQQRGTSKREDVLDTVIALRRPQDYNPSQGARFEVH